MHRERAFPWGYGHILIFGSIAATGAGLHVAAYYIGDEAHIDATATVLTVAVPSWCTCSRSSRCTRSWSVLTLFALYTFPGPCRRPIPPRPAGRDRSAAHHSRNACRYWCADGDLPRRAHARAPRNRHRLRDRRTPARGHRSSAHCRLRQASQRLDAVITHARFLGPAGCLPARSPSTPAVLGFAPMRTRHRRSAAVSGRVRPPASHRGARPQDRLHIDGVRDHRDVVSRVTLDELDAHQADRHERHRQPATMRRTRPGGWIGR